MKAQPNSQREHKNDTQAKNGSYLLYHNSAGVNTTVTNIPEERIWSSGDFRMCSCCCLQKSMSFHLDFLLCAAVYSANQRCFSLCGRHTYQQMKIKRCATMEATVTLVKELTSKRDTAAYIDVDEELPLTAFSFHPQNLNIAIKTFIS